jgi:nitrate reductase gamma subunit
MREQLLFVVVPYWAAISLLLVPIVRGAVDRGRPAAIRPSGTGSVVSWAWRWGLILLVACHLVAFLLPRAIAWLNRGPAGNVLSEVIGLACAGLAVGGLIALAMETLRAWRALRELRMLRRFGSLPALDAPAGPLEPPPAPKLADTLLFWLLVLAVVSGLIVTVRFRWASSWYGNTLLPYLRSLARLRPDLEPMLEMPLAVRLHTVSGFLAAAVFPFTRGGRLLARPWLALLRRPASSRHTLRRVPERRLGAVAKAGVAGLLLLLGALALGSADALRRVGSSQGYAPAQPIAFSHRLHAGVNQIPCLYCHFAAERSRHAGIPALNVCMNCHAQIRLASAELQKLKEAVAQNRPVRWIKIHNLPDFVYFNHSQHVTVAKLACQRCHGPVETMERVAQQAPLTMGWCIGCHRSAGVVPPGQSRFGPAATIAHRPAGRGMGGQDCSKCHY